MSDEGCRTGWSFLLEEALKSLLFSVHKAPLTGYCVDKKHAFEILSCRDVGEFVLSFISMD